MTDYSYTTVPGKIPTLLDKIREVGVPRKATLKWIKSVGFTSSNDSGLLGILKFIGFTDQSGVPTKTWSDYRGGKHGQILATAVRKAYSGLFDVYPDADARSNQDLQHVIATNTSAGKQVITKTVRTFKKLCESADFSAVGRPVPTKKSPKSSEKEGDDVNNPEISPEAGGANPSLHIDIQVHISPDASSEQIDKIFESMSRHLYTKGK